LRTAGLSAAVATPRPTTPRGPLAGAVDIWRTSRMDTHVTHYAVIGGH
jgi:hypothetical protein